MEMMTLELKRSVELIVAMLEKRYAGVAWEVLPYAEGWASIESEDVQVLVNLWGSFKVAEAPWGEALKLSAYLRGREASQTCGWHRPVGMPPWDGPRRVTPACPTIGPLK